MTTTAVFSIRKPRFACWLFLPLVVALASAAEGPTDGDTTDDDAIETTEPAAPPPGEARFWEAVLQLENTDADKQKRGRELLREAADLEFPLAQCYLGECHLRGSDGFKRDERRATEWFRLSAERGQPLAKAYLGMCYMLGLGTRKNPEAARAWLAAAIADAPTYEQVRPPDWFFEQRDREKSPVPSEQDPPVADTGPTLAETLFASAHFYLGQLLDEAEQPAGALAHYEAAARYGEQGRAGIYAAARKAALAYALGHGTTRDLVKANAMLEQSRQLAHRRSLASFHSLWSRREVDNFDLEALEKALAQFADGQLQHELQNVAEVLVRENPAEAVKWCQLAADNGEGWAMIKLAELHSSALLGAPDPVAAFRWYQKAAEEEDIYLAWGNYAACLQRGIGTERDAKKAAELAARHGRDNFMCALVGADRVPSGGLLFEHWWKELEQAARETKLPDAQYHYALQCLIFSRRPARPPFIKPLRDSALFALMESAAKAGHPHALAQLGAMYEDGFVKRADIGRAIASFEAAMNAGSSAAAMRLAELAATGVGQRADVDRAMRCYERALELEPDNAHAHNDLAVLYEHMLKEKPGSVWADRWRSRMTEGFEAADRLENAYGAFNLGRLRYEGVLVEQDYEQAYLYFQTAAERGHTIANRYLGRMHDRGEGVPETPKDALYYYRLAALDGDLESLRAVRDFYLHGRSGSVDLERAAFWLERLVRAGDAAAWLDFGDLLMDQGRYYQAFRLWNAQRKSTDIATSARAHERLSRMYRDGLGVKPNPKRAKQYFDRAVKDGNPDALCRQGRELIVGRQASAAVPLLRLAMEANSAEALYLLGCLHFAGDGVSHDMDAGWRLVRAAAEANYAEAQVSLAIAALRERAGAPTLEEALRWAEAAEAAGHPKAKAVREELEAKRQQQPAETDSGRARSA